MTLSRKSMSKKERTFQVASKETSKKMYKLRHHNLTEVNCKKTYFCVTFCRRVLYIL